MIGALRPSELKKLDRAKLLLLGARCALRVKPWVLAQDFSPWDRGMSFLLLAIDKAPLAADASTEMKSMIELSAVNRPSATDEVALRCSNYAISTLASAIEVAAYELSPGLVKGIIATAKLSASVFTSRAHVKVESKVEETSFVDIVIEAI